MPVSHKQTKSRFVSIMVKFCYMALAHSRYQNKVTVTVLGKILTGKQHQLTFARPCLCEQLHTVNVQTVMNAINYRYDFIPVCK